MAFQFFNKDFLLNQIPKFKSPLHFGQFHLGISKSAPQAIEGYGYPLVIKGIENPSTLLDYRIYGNTKQSELPDGYTQLEYIEADGTQYIDTGLSTGKFIHDIQFTTTDRNLMGFSTTAGTFWGTEDGDSSFELGISEIPANTTARNYITFNTLDSDNFTLSVGDSVINFAKSSVVTTYALCHVPNSDYFCHAKLYGFYAFDSTGNLTQDLIPAKRNSDNAIGMYDLVTETFFTNSGTGDFIAGVEAPTEQVPIQMQGVGDKTKNLFNKNQNFTDKTYLNSDGTITNNNFWIITDYIPVKGNNFTLTRSNALGIPPCIVGYDVNKNMIASTAYNSAKVVNLNSDKEIAFIRFSISKSSEDLDVIQLEEGTQATSYEPFGYRINVTATSEDKTQTETVSFCLDEPLYRLGDYKDYVDYRNQVVVRNIEVIDNTGTKHIKDSLKGLHAPKIETIVLPDLPVYEGTTTYTVEGLSPTDMYGKGAK